MVSYGLDDFDESDAEEEGYSTLASPLAGRRAVAREKPRVSFVDLSAHLSPLASPTLPLALDDLDADSDISDDSSFDAAAPVRKAREYSVEDAEDSEEEAWPVDPPRHRPHLSKLDVLTNDRWSLGEDAERATTWNNISLAFSRNLKELHARQVEVTEAARLRRLAEVEAEEAEIAGLLRSLTLEHDVAAEKAARDFEERNRKLWETINATIAATEELAAQQAAEEEAQRKAQAAAEKAQAEAKAEAKRKADERLAKEKAELAARKKALEAREQERLKTEADLKARIEIASGPLREYERWTEKMRSIKANVLPAVSEDPTLRKACALAKRQITPKVGMLVNTAESVTTITGLLSQTLVTLQQMSSIAYTWGLNHLSKSLIRQAETEITAKQSVAFPLARVVIGLVLRGHTELGDVLMARLVKKCFWVTACYPRKTEGISDEAHLKILGHTVPGESSVQYSERMAGILALYAAILQTSPLDHPQTTPNLAPEEGAALVPAHFQPNAGWTWMGQTLLPPIIALEPVPNLLETFLNVAGAGMHEVFGPQFLKLLTCLYDDGLKGKQAKFSDKARASQVKLELLLEEWLQGNRIADAEGRFLEKPATFD